MEQIIEKNFSLGWVIIINTDTWRTTGNLLLRVYMNRINIALMILNCATRFVLDFYMYSRACIDYALHPVIIAVTRFSSYSYTPDRCNIM
jgi:hypothetical protein